MEEKQTLSVSQYADLYEHEGYHLSASADIYVPWFQCTLKCKCIVKQPMSGLDMIVCKCIEREINTIKDISFVLALEPQIVSGEIEDLVFAEILVKNGSGYDMTETGKDAYHNSLKAEKTEKEFNVFMNAITGKWEIDNAGFISELIVPDHCIKLQPLCTIVKIDIENNDELRTRLQCVDGLHIRSVSLLDYKMVLYAQEKILFYKNDQQKLLFSLFSCQTMELDTVLADALVKKYERRELLELIQVEKLIKDADKHFLTDDKLLSSCKQEPASHKYYRNKEIRELFKHIFDLAQKEVFIVSPWIDNHNYVVTEAFLTKMETALCKKNIEISIGYGYISPQKMALKKEKYAQEPDREKMAQDRDWQTELMAEKLRKRFAEYANFSIFYVGTHEKILSYDERFTLIGSYNLLSYDGGESNHYTGLNFRYENGVMVDDPVFARYVKSELMR